MLAARFRVHSADDDYHWIDGPVKPYTDGDGTTDGVIAALRVVDYQVEAERKLQRLARFDTLTGLANRAETLARLEAALDDSRTPGTYLGILFCDVDHFKTINDTWGHAIGDVVLTTLVTGIGECVRSEDSVGRMGGDEILVLLPGIHSLDEAVDIAEAIRTRGMEPIHESDVTVHMTLSIGATVVVHGESVTTMMARADDAMYRAKDAGRNSVTRT